MLKRALRHRRLLGLLAISSVVLAFSAVAAFASSPGPVKVKDDLYAPKTLTVGRGTTVTWQWAGVLRHNVTVKSGPANFRSKTQVRGTFRYRFTKAGTYHLYCTIHPFMKMTIVVR